MCPPNHLPNLGYIVDDKAVGFLYQTDSAVAYLDLIIANKDVPHNDAINEIVEKLCEVAKLMGVEVIISMSKVGAVVDRSLKHNFVSTDEYTVMFKKLD